MEFLTHLTGVGREGNFVSVVGSPFLECDWNVTVKLGEHGKRGVVIECASLEAY